MVASIDVRVAVRALPVEVPRARTCASNRVRTGRPVRARGGDPTIGGVEDHLVALDRERNARFHRPACAAGLPDILTGTRAFGTVGPDLTHMASRASPGAGELPKGRC